MKLERIRCRRRCITGFLVWHRLGHCSRVKSRAPPHNGSDFRMIYVRSARIVCFKLKKKSATGLFIDGLYSIIVSSQGKTAPDSFSSQFRFRTGGSQLETSAHDYPTVAMTCASTMFAKLNLGDLFFSPLLWPSNFMFVFYKLVCFSSALPKTLIYRYQDEVEAK